jgi:hypothetical protein
LIPRFLQDQRAARGGGKIFDVNAEIEVLNG